MEVTCSPGNSGQILRNVVIWWNDPVTIVSKFCTVANEILILCREIYSKLKLMSYFKNHPVIGNIFPLAFLFTLRKVDLRCLEWYLENS
jgi:hypothetical protein